MIETFESQLEILDVASGERRVVYRTPDHIEAPNWSPDGRRLAFVGYGAPSGTDHAATV
jgi:Tol biopolymer transport system component